MCFCIFSHIAVHRFELGGAAIVRPLHRAGGHPSDFVVQPGDGMGFIVDHLADPIVLAVGDCFRIDVRSDFIIDFTYIVFAVIGVSKGVTVAHADIGNALCQVVIVLLPVILYSSIVLELTDSVKIVANRLDTLPVSVGGSGKIA